MPFYADLHIHSKYSRACSRDCDLEHLAWWAQRKGVALLGTGDVTHPAWYAHLRDLLAPAEPGLYRLRDDVEQEIGRRLPAGCRRAVRFMLSVEIATIYKRDGRTRKVHHLIYLPDFDAADRFTRMLGRIGNLGSDGRPILGLDSRDLLEITLESSPDGYLVPAHVWTPWFSALGSKSGFDAVADCYADLAGHIFAVETGLSSDPPMNWRVSSLDRYRLVSNSDAHSPPALAREASVFGTDLDYYAVRRALETGEGYLGSLEFFPEEGKYHLDGHRACGVRLEPAETRQAGDRCPACGKPVTVGVLHRVEALADRPEGGRPPGAAGYRNFIQLPQIMAEILGVGPKSKGVARAVDALVARLGPELAIIEQTPVDEIEASSPLLAEAVARLRRGEVSRQAGYDGEYGTITVFAPGELDRPRGGPVLFDVEDPVAAPEADASRVAVAPPAGEHGPAGKATDRGEVPEPLPGTESVAGPLAMLDNEQRAAASVTEGPLLVVAGPGTGKTRMLTHRIAHLIRERGVPSGQFLAVTFTRRAAAELRERLGALVPEEANGVTVTTFHGLGLRILREAPDRAGLSPAFRVADDAERLAAGEEVTGSARDARRLLAEPTAGADDDRARYEKALRARDLVDVDELVPLAVVVLAENPDLLERLRARWRHVSVDEYQDVDEPQYRLLRLLVPVGGNICAIGDPDQAIYGFRGADVRFFLRFAEDFPDGQRRQLTRNYRSTVPIVAAASHAIRAASLEPGRVLSAVHRDPQAPLVRTCRAATPEDEAEFVARSIDQLIGGSSHHSLDSGRVDSREVAAPGLSFSDVAVVYRTDAQAEAVVAALTRAGMPFQKRSHDRLAQRPGVAEIARELRLADGAGAAGDVTGRVRRVAAALLDRPGGGEERVAEINNAVELLLPLAQRCGDDVPRLLAELATGVEVDALDPRADRISLLTLHAAKGLEYAVVFLVGCEDGLLPLRLPGREPDADQVAEERRLFFVGLTRARLFLYLSHARQRSRHGTRYETRPSPFLGAIDSALLEAVGDSAGPSRRRARQSRLF